MQAHESLLLPLLSNQAGRFVVPVYQRRYSWDEEQCAQLWEDIVLTGRGNGTPHFTGSIVTISNDVFDLSGVNPVLIIDGQQRITTITLLLIALYRYSKGHPDENLSFSWGEIQDRGFLFDKYRSGDSHYELTLSEDDRDTLRSLVDNLVNPDVKILTDSQRLLENLAFFEERLEAIDDPNVVWSGMQRLEVVYVALKQGADNPQLIFESMNSTGKQLSSADLIRNFILMGHVNQDNLYKTYWHPIEELLGTSTDDNVFDEFIRAYLTCVNAPTVVNKSEVYSSFKRHHEAGGYGRTAPVESLLKEMGRFAGYYAAINGGEYDDTESKRLLDRISRLDFSVATPLLMSFLDDYEGHAFSIDDLRVLLATTESYLFRRSICYGSSQGLNNFLPSLIARLNRVQEEGGNYVEAFQAMLMNETATARRFPRDDEFAIALRTRDCYHYRRALFMLGALENSFHPKDERDFSTGTYTIEHIMPQNALAHDEWRAMIGDISEEDFAALLHNIGNLTLTAYNSELSDGTFQEKKTRAIGGYGNEYMSISAELHEADSWTPASIKARAEHLIAIALSIWPAPKMDDATRKLYVQERKAADQGKQITFKDLFNSGYVKAGDQLHSVGTTYPGIATVTDDGMIELKNGEVFASPSVAHIRLMQLHGSPRTSSNGWYTWRLNNESGPLLNDLRKQLNEENLPDNMTALARFRVSFWRGLYEWLAESPSFLDAFYDPSDRKDNRDYWCDFGIGLHCCHVSLHAYKRDSFVEAGLWYPSGKKYDQLLANRAEIEDSLAEEGSSFIWAKADENTKGRWFYVRREFDYDTENWSEAYGWLENMSMRLRAIALEAHA